MIAAVAGAVVLAVRRNFVIPEAIASSLRTGKLYRIEYIFYWILFIKIPRELDRIIH